MHVHLLASLPCPIPAVCGHFCPQCLQSYRRIVSTFWLLTTSTPSIRVTFFFQSTITSLFRIAYPSCRSGVGRAMLYRRHSCRSKQLYLVREGLGVWPTEATGASCTPVTQSRRGPSPETQGAGFRKAWCLRHFNSCTGRSSRFQSIDSPIRFQLRHSSRSSSGDRYGLDIPPWWHCGQ